MLFIVADTLQVMLLFVLCCEQVYEEVYNSGTSDTWKISSCTRCFPPCRETAREIRVKVQDCMEMTGVRGQSQGQGQGQAGNPPISKKKSVHVKDQNSENEAKSIHE